MYQYNKKTDFKQPKLPKNQYISIMNNVYYCKNLYVCIWFTFARFRRSAAQRLVGIYSYTAYALQRAAPLQQNACILLGLGLRTSKLFDGNINKSLYTLCLYAYSKVRICTVSCIWYASARLPRRDFFVD